MNSIRVFLHCFLHHTLLYWGESLSISIQHGKRAPKLAASRMTKKMNLKNIGNAGNKNSSNIKDTGKYSQWLNHSRSRKSRETSKPKVVVFRAPPLRKHPVAWTRQPHERTRLGFCCRAVAFRRHPSPDPS